MKLTAWYAGNQKPARVGVYQRQYPGKVYHCYWDGSQWGVGFVENNPATLAISKRFKSRIVGVPWRGINNGR